MSTRNAPEIVLGITGSIAAYKAAELVRLIVKAGWCGHCKSAMPEFQRLVAATPVTLKDGSSVTIRMLDEGADKAEVQTLQVKGFPTILYRGPSGDRMEYSGPRTYDGIMGFLKNL